MSLPDLHMATLLEEAHREGAFTQSIVSTHQGLPVVTVGDNPELIDALSALTALFDDVVLRAERDVGLASVDELAIRDDARGVIVVRPLGDSAGTRLFLVVEVPPRLPWRRVTNKFCRALAAPSD